MLNNLFSVTVSVSAVVLLLIIARPLLCKLYKAKLRYFIWLFIAIRLLIPFNIASPYSIINIPSVSDADIYYTAEHDDTAMQIENIQTDVKLNPSPEAGTAILSLKNIIIMIWGIGAIIFLMYHIIWYIIFKRKINVWSTVTENKKPQIAICKKISSPMMFGLVKPTILLPDLEYPREDLNMIIAHETVHYKRKDIWYKFILMLCSAVHWFNPVVYLMVYYANKDLEFSCDEIVIQNRDMNYKKAYSRSILNAIRTERGGALSTYFKGGKKDMKERFSNILKNEKKKRGVLIFIIAILITLLSGTLIACNNNTVSKDKFSFLSAEWGASWEKIQEDTGLEGEVQEKGDRQIAEIKDVEYLGVKGTAIFQLDKQLDNTYYGLYDVIFAYEDTDEEKIIAEMQKIYGERKNSYSDKNGVENPIGFSGGWVSKETIEASMTETEKEKYTEMMGNIEQTRKDAILRSPLVSIIVDEERNIIEFKGSAAATVKYMKENNR